MPMTFNRLTAKEVKDAKGKSRISDGGGLWLQVSEAGAKSWLFIYRWEGKRPELGLGPYPSVSLAEARRRADIARGCLAAKPKRDPRSELTKGATAPCIHTFGSFTEDFLAEVLPDFRNAKHQQQWRNTLRSYAAHLWGMDIAVIDTDAVLEVLRPVWPTKRETARRLRGRIERILDAAKAKGLRSGENPARWRGHLSAILPNQKKAKTHFAAVPFERAPAFVASLRKSNSLSAKALEFTILTASRSSEARGATWDEIDLERAVWNIPATRMKANRPHRVPLSSAATNLLKELKALQLGGLVFPGTSPTKPISEAAVRKLLKRLHPDGATIHGFRSSFRDWAGERTDFPREVAEQALAHNVGDQTERAYRRGDALEKRRALMEAWSEYLGRVHPYTA